MTDVQTPSPEAALEADLAVFSRTPAFARGVRDALGADPEQPLPAGSGLVFHLVRASGDVLTCYLLTAAGFVLHEHAVSGDSLTVAIPMWRVTRVQSSRTGGMFRAVIELDADRKVTRTSAVDGVADGIIDPAAYVIDGEGVEAETVAAFTAELRCVMLGLWQ
jgi:hypothetical protein